MLLTTISTLQDRRIGEYKGVVSGEAILGANAFRDMFAGIRDIVGGRSAAYERELPAVVQCFRDDFEACIAHLRFPLRHRRVIRTTNLLERLFLEERRRTKIIPHAFGERPVLKLMYAAVIRAAERWRGIAGGEFEQRQLRAIRDELGRAHAERVAPAVTPRHTTPVRKLRADR